MEMDLDALLAQPNRFSLNELVEVIDFQDCSLYRLAVVKRLLGDRLQVCYVDEPDDPIGYWFSQRSHVIHKVGWSRAVRAPTGGRTNPDLLFPCPDKSEFMTTPFPRVEISSGSVKSKMWFEMRHPTETHKIVPGFVDRKLKRGYFVAATDWCRAAGTQVEFTLHVTSDYILPVNFCRDHGIEMEPPDIDLRQLKGQTFTWDKYFTAFPNDKSLDVSAIAEEKQGKNRFKVGDKIEAGIIITPNKVRPATVVQVAGHLIKVKFDNRPSDRDKSYQWMSCVSSQLYPVGYWEIVMEQTFGKKISPPSAPLSEIESETENELQLQLPSPVEPSVSVVELALSNDPDPEDNKVQDIVAHEPIGMDVVDADAEDLLQNILNDNDDMMSGIELLQGFIF